MAVSLATGGGCTVAAQMDADFYASVFGEDPIVLNIGGKCEPTITDATTVHISDGVFLIQGRQVVIDEDDFTIPSGTVTTYYCGYEIYTEDGVDKVRQFVDTKIPTNAAQLRDNAENAYGTLLIIATSSTAITKAVKLMSDAPKASTELVTESKSMDDFTEPGRYYAFANLTDAPLGKNGWIEVEAYKDGSGREVIWQRYYPWTSGAIQAMWTRIKSGAEWGTWSCTPWKAGTNVEITDGTISAKNTVTTIGSTKSSAFSIAAKSQQLVEFAVPSGARFINMRCDNGWLAANNGLISGGKAHANVINWSDSTISNTQIECIYSITTTTGG